MAWAVGAILLLGVPAIGQGDGGTQLEDGGVCSGLPADSWTGGPSGRFVVLPAVEIPWGPWAEYQDRLVWFQAELTDGPTDRASADRAARAARAAHDPYAMGRALPRWVVVEIDGGYHAFAGELFSLTIGTEVNPMLGSACRLPASSVRHRLVAMYTKWYDAPPEGRYLGADWTLEDGLTIEDLTTGEVLVSGQVSGDLGEPPGVPFEAGPEADAWLGANVASRVVGDRCEPTDPDRDFFGAGVLTVVVCPADAGGRWSDLVFALYESRATLDAFFERQAVLGQSTCGPRWHPQGAPLATQGQVRCVLLDGRSVILWTEEGWRVAAWTRATDGDQARLLTAWSGLARHP